MNLAKQSEDLKYVLAIEPKNSQAATINGNDVDGRGFRSASYLIATGLASGTPTAFSIAYKLQEKELSGDDYADVSGYSGTLAGASDAYEKAVLDVNLENRKRYTRMVAVLTFTGGSTPAIPLSCVAILGNPYEIPVTQGTP